MMGHHEHRGVERRFVTPPAPPGVVGPGPAIRAELVGAHDLRADVVVEVADQVVVEAATATRVGAVGPAGGGAGPGEHLAGVGMPERPLETLSNAGTVAVRRDVEVLYLEQLRHVHLLACRCRRYRPAAALKLIACAGTLQRDVLVAT